ncbi:C40 family peptidase [Paenibacillus sp. YYML68]|uniref:C40 family peptidase n=1 Tax=Paenibacillus sp. YYML68 TaxID=2909250 RepID=UPI002490AB5C|nr:C40 family peptidase [Paenibacillus sp. YYML68]
MLLPHKGLRTVCMTAAMTALLTGAFAGTASAAYDDMDAVSLVKEMVGKEYTSKQQSPTRGFDASGLNYYIFKMMDYKLPRALDDQFKIDKPLVKTLSTAKPGDVLFFGKGNDPSFSGIYVGDGKMVIASSYKDEVVTRSVSVHEKQFIGGRRVLSKQDQLAIQVILYGQEYMGTPYVFGAKYGQTETFDCSSFVKWVYNKYGIDLPRVSRNQAKEGKYVSRSNLEAGDLVFFTTRSSKGQIGHVGIYVGNGMMLHTYGDGGVKFDTIESGWWNEHYVTARRVIN